MTDWTKYSDEELERLTTLTEATAKPGEFVRDNFGGIVYRLVDAVAFVDGKTRCNLTASLHERRVTSFTDATELDPPQAEMLAELARRKAPPLRFRKGDVVVHDGTNSGHLAVSPDVTRDATHMRVVWDRRLNGTCLVDEVDWLVKFFRLATPADIAAYEARIPTAPVFKVGELVMDLACEWGIVRIVEPFDSRYYRADGVTYPQYGRGIFDASKLRPATDAEVAAYHRAHCQPKPESVKPVVISNATHAGQWVKWLGRPCKVLSITNLVFTPACGLIAVADEDGCVCHIRPNEAILIDPPTWPQ